jgi:hypothetical protein
LLLGLRSNLACTEPKNASHVDHTVTHHVFGRRPQWALLVRDVAAMRGMCTLHRLHAPSALVPKAEKHQSASASPPFPLALYAAPRTRAHRHGHLAELVCHRRSSAPCLPIVSHEHQHPHRRVVYPDALFPGPNLCWRLLPPWSPLPWAAHAMAEPLHPSLAPVEPSRRCSVVA